MSCVNEGCKSHTGRKENTQETITFHRDINSAGNSKKSFPATSSEDKYLAYGFIRNQFADVLPHPKAFSAWYKGVGCNPGSTLQIDAKNKKSTYQTTSLMPVLPVHNNGNLKLNACGFKAKGLNNYMKPDWLPEHNDGKNYTPSYNIAPTDVTPVLVSASKFKNSAKSSRVLKPMMWGIIPPWHKGDYRNHNISTNNCRIENLMSSKLYRPIVNNGGRCVIVLEGFYEWQTTNKVSKVKQPYYIYSPQKADIKVDNQQTWNNTFDEDIGWKGIKLLHMAGLYNVWQNEDKIIYSYSVITMESNGTLDWLHHRMPAILDTDELIEAWLDIDNVPANVAVSLLKPTEALCWHRVSTKVNNSRYKANDCNKELKEEKKDSSKKKTLNMWFTKTNKRESDSYSDVDSKKLKK